MSSILIYSWEKPTEKMLPKTSHIRKIYHPVSLPTNTFIHDSLNTWFLCRFSGRMVLMLSVQVDKARRDGLHPEA